MDQVDIFRNLILMASADGRLDEAELQWLSHQAAARGITDDEFEEALQAAVSREAEICIPRDPGERIAMLKDMLRVMAADGRIAPGEKNLFALMSATMGVAPEELNRLIDTVLAEDDC